jgi:hypothetical protein
MSDQEKLIPKQQQQSGTLRSDSQYSGNTVTWNMNCQTPDGLITAGELHYQDILRRGNHAHARSRGIAYDYQAERALYRSCAVMQDRQPWDEATQFALFGCAVDLATDKALPSELRPFIAKEAV